MRYLQSTELAVDSLLFMAAHPGRDEFPAEEVARVQGVSATYLAKVFQQLARAGLLRSHRGPKGGYALGRQPAEITLLDVARVLEGDRPLYRCRAESRSCSLGPRCRIVGAFREAERRMNEVLQGVTLADLLEDAGPSVLAGANRQAPLVAGSAKH